MWVSDASAPGGNGYFRAAGITAPQGLVLSQRPIPVDLTKSYDFSVWMSLIIWNYRNAAGFDYGQTYSRRSRLDMWDNGAIDPVAKTIRLRAPFPADMGNPDEPNGAWPAGHPVSNTRSGMTHQYCLFQGYWPTSWTERQGTFSGIDATGTNSCAFRPGTAYMRPHILAHYTIANGTPVTVDIANVRIARNP